VTIRNLLTAALGALTLGAFSILGGAYTAPHAYAQPLAQARPLTSTAMSTFNICLRDAIANECIISHGGGNQVTIDTSNFAVFHVVNINPGNGDWQLENAGGHCLRAYADGSVGLAFGGCNSTNTAEYWHVSYDPNLNRTTYESMKYPTYYMGTYGTSSGLGVWIDQPKTGFFAGWNNT
jgi:hypothetical protein